MQGWTNTNFDDFVDLLTDSDLAEEPVPLEVFLHDKQFLSLKLVSDLQKQIITKSSQIFLPHTLEALYGEQEAKRIWDEDTVNEVVCLLGKGSGKDYCARISFAYVIYKLHCLKDPVGYYGKSTGTYIDLLNLAVNAEQADNVFFTPLRNILTASPWFQRVGFEPRQKKIEFNERPIRLFSGNSEAEAWEGLDLLVVVLDEIAAFRTESQLKGENRNRLSAKAIYDMSKISVTSRFPDTGKVICLSFPRYRNDFIMTRYEESAREPKVYRLKASTWEVNPLISRAQLENEFQRKPVESKARFMCEPPMAADAFFRNPDAVRACFKADISITDKGLPTEKLLYNEIEDLKPIDEYGRFKAWFRPGDNYQRFIHVDLASKRDRAALAMCHSPGSRKIEVAPNLYEQLPVVVMDLIHYWEAIEGEEIDFQGIREFIAHLHRMFPVSVVSFDQWNSVDLIQSLNKRGIYSELHPVKISDYDTLSTCFNDGRFSGYYNRRLIDEELLQLQLLPGRKVDHTNCLDKDTRIPCLDGTIPTIEELVGKQTWVYSCNEQGKIVPGLAEAVATKVTSELIDIILDNGSVTRCTPDHPWMLRDGSYKEAKDLKPGIDRLMPINRIWPVNGGYELLSNLNGERILTHRMVIEYFSRKPNDNELIHHKNENKIDNRPENLEIISKSDHGKYHCTSRHKAISEWREAMSMGTIEFNKLESTKLKRSKYMSNLSKEDQIKRARNRPLFREDINFESLKSVSSEETANSAARSLNCGRNVIIRVLKDNNYNSWEEFKNSINNNHKVRAIIKIKLEKPIQTYDLQVLRWHNFALAGGVFVHNSGYKDGSDALAGAVQQACTYMDIDQEIEIDIIGTDEDWDDFETQEAIAEESNRTKAPKQVHHVTYNDSEDQEFNFEVV